MLLAKFVAHIIFEISLLRPCIKCMSAQNILSGKEWDDENVGSRIICGKDFFVLLLSVGFKTSLHFIVLFLTKRSVEYEYSANSSRNFWEFVVIFPDTGLHSMLTNGSNKRSRNELHAYYIHRILLTTDHYIPPVCSDLS
jgi:hypothetical protein